MKVLAIGGDFCFGYFHRIHLDNILDVLTNVQAPRILPRDL
jgi:hypothetical protein